LIERSGYSIIALLCILSLAFLIIHPLISILLLLFAIFTAYFFRDPERDIGEGIVSPADGKVDYISGNRLEIFMSPLDCHVNRSPVSGEVKSVKFFEGKTPPAFMRVEGVRKNEIVIRNSDGDFKIQQIAGFFARRIVCYVKPGDRVVKGQRIGMIRFGSRVALEVPDGFVFAIKVGEKVKAGETVAFKDEYIQASHSS